MPDALNVHLQALL